MEWVEQGGNILFTIRPDPSEELDQVDRKMGIFSRSKQLIETTGVRFLTNLFPGVITMEFGSDFMTHTSLGITLEKTAIVHLVSADEWEIPILWEYPHGDGRVVVINSDQYVDKGSRGLVAAAYNLLLDVAIFPVINGSAFFIDDFPAPIPEGKDEDIFQQFGRDIESFYLNVWWPDMQSIQQKYKLRYSTVVIETYRYDLNPPFFYQSGQSDLINYFGASVLRDNGEIGIHGYNHVPLCQPKDGLNQVLDYPTWATEESMQLAVKELNQFTTEMFPEQIVQVYVPPSNMLCDDARAWLPAVLPDIRIIASVYLPDENVPAYVQEFEEAEDGIIELPRIVSGYDPDNYSRWVAANELYLHFVAGHFVHPDDVLDQYRSEGNSWITLRERLDEYLLWLYSSAPQIRNLTASEQAMAVQRFSRLDPVYACDADSCQITLNGFYDEAWLLMRTDRDPESVINGDFSRISSDLYLIEANQDTLSVLFKE